MHGKTNLIRAPWAVPWCVAIALVAGAAWAGSVETSDRWMSWKTLRLKAKAAPLFRGTMEMHLNEDGTRLETETSARFFGARVAASRTETLLDEETRLTRRFSSRSKKRGRRYEFGDDGFVMEKIKPKRPGAAEPEWYVAVREEFPYPDDETAAGPFDYYGMLLYLKQVPLDRPGDEVTLYVATSKGPKLYRIRVGEARRNSRTLTDLSTGKKKTVRLREFRLRITPADPDSDAEGFMRMEGETELWVEARSKTPLEISGKVPKVPGRVVLRLVGMR